MLCRLPHISPADPIVFERSFAMRWRNGMHSDGPLAANRTRARALAWLYPWAGS